MNETREMAQHPAVKALKAKEQKKYDQEYFALHYWREDLPGVSGNRGLSYDDPSHELRFSYLYKVLYDVVSGTTKSTPRILDAGCGPGKGLREFLLHGINAYGIDISPQAGSLSQQLLSGCWHNRFCLASLSNIPFRDDSFDFCICTDVLEHLVIFDIFSAVLELCRVTSYKIICSINTDNPYEYHPTILSRDSWIAIFESTNMVEYNLSDSSILNQIIQKQYAEYDFFVFDK